MKDALVLIAILTAWIVLNRWVLPYFGVQTCMSGGCCGATCVDTNRNRDSAPASALNLGDVDVNTCKSGSDETQE